MTKYFICSAFILVLFTAMTKKAQASEKTKYSINMVENNSDGKKLPLQSSTEMPIKSAPISALPHSPAEKGHSHLPALDETPHIHHFHKNRVKKLKKHHDKFWFLSKALIIATHIVLLLMAYMHAAH